jgi:cytochrome c oxidase subunit 3
MTSIHNAVLRITSGGHGDDVPGTPAWAARRRHRPQSVYGMGLWVFIGVATTLFSLFVVAYTMRMSQADAAAIAMPSQLWVSTALLLAGSVLLQRARTEALIAHDAAVTQRWLLAGGACAFLFLAAQWWAWQALMDRAVTASGNPAGSFFYLLTTMHGLHVAGGLIGWTIVARGAWRARDPDGGAWRVALVARYWHFLLLVWLALYACFTWITPEVARIICRAPVA